MARAPRLPLSIKVGLILFVVVAGALALVYAAVVPRLESQLVDAKIDELEATVPTATRIVERRAVVQDAARSVGQTFDVRAVIFTELTDDSLLPVADSNSSLSSADVQRDPLALEALGTGQAASGRVPRGGEDFAEVAIPLPPERVLLLSAPLEDVLSSVQTVRKSLIAAGIASLAVSWLAGYLAAWGFTRRIRRLEGAAERLAAGDFSTPVHDPSRDEVGQLADAFDGMRVRLAALDRARGEFIANASHELRTPLFSLGGFLELLSGEELDEDVRRDFLAEMRGQVSRLTRLATDLLDLSRLDAGHLEVERVPVDLAECGRVVCEEFRALAESEGHELTAAAEGPVTALGDEVRVQQVARALVENALRHTPAGTHVSLHAGERDGRAFLTVRDDGPGIPAEDRAHLFERFYRAGGGKASGSGLGLAIASELATRMGGSLEYQSEPGSTVFTLLLPTAEIEKTRENGSSQMELSASLP
jgi:two-component system OmpR family sensor kinase